MKNFKFRISAVLFLLAMLISTVAFGAVADDFAFKGLRLGDSYDTMVEKLGEPDFDTDMYLRGVHVIRYTYSADQKIYVDADDKKVVEMFCKSKHYVGPHGVTYGATRAGLQKAFGQAEHKHLDGNIYYIYYNPVVPKEKLLIEMETEQRYLLSWTYTSLELDDPGIIITFDEEEKKPAQRFNYGGLPTN
ncbi:hypothetical protein D081_1232 [Anaerovibrio sp. JC8]|uniref:hypothetical protein n=1 Tax=Anaerovibrio sp. JC8 TaxID=1240085 RepID=UPI000A099CFE|nr:hypothetical protein [Anaerovibrio sp. JC8]ORU00138.1 hypothetical protein D081_1232 [Anaerovibrio sp. JC8]